MTSLTTIASSDGALHTGQVLSIQSCLSSASLYMVSTSIDKHCSYWCAPSTRTHSIALLLHVDETLKLFVLEKAIAFVC